MLVVEVDVGQVEALQALFQRRPDVLWVSPDFPVQLLRLSVKVVSELGGEENAGTVVPLVEDLPDELFVVAAPVPAVPY